MKRRSRTLRRAALAAALWLLAPLAGGEEVQASRGPVFVMLEDAVWTVAREVDGAVHPLTADLAFDASSPALSPDGARVAFEVPGQGILVCSIDERGPCDTLKTRVGWPVRPTWNPVTGELVFVRFVADSSGEDSEIVVASSDLGTVRPLIRQTGSQDSPDVSPDGTLLVYDSAQTVALHQAGVQVIRQLWVMNLESGVARPLVPDAAQDMQPDFSPDGTRVAFASNRGGGFDIWIVGVDGSGLRQVTSGAGSKTWPAWSPDGGALLYTRLLDGRSELWKIASDGSGAARYELAGSGSDAQFRDADWR